MKKLLLSIIAVFVTVAALGTSTFAWFTLSNKAEVGEFNANVTAGDGIEISLDGTTWYTTLPSSVINEELVAKYGGVPVLSDVTTPDLETFNKISVTDVVENPVGTLKEVEVTSGFIKFQLFFRAQTSKNIYWVDGSIGSATTSWTPDTSFLNSDGTTSVTTTASINVRAAHAARVGILGTVGPKVFELPNGLNSTVHNSNSATISNNGAIAYHNAKNPDNKFPATTGHAMIPTFNSFGNNTPTTGNGVLVTELSKDVDGVFNYKGTVQVLVWLEGWDADTFNAILGKAISVSLKFEGTAA